MRTTTEFNQKYIKSLQESYPGLVIEVPSLIQFLDYVFQDLTKIENFKFKEISILRGLPKIQSNLEEILPFVGRVMNQELEEKISLILKVEFEVEQRLLSLGLDKKGKQL